MPELKNFVAVDWRSGRDRCYFFFKDDDTYSRYNNSEGSVASSHPTAVTQDNWGEFHPHAQDLCFGFSTDRIVGTNRLELDADILWLFYYNEKTPMVCEYDQDADTPFSFTPVSESIWSMLLPYFDDIIAGTFWQRPFRSSGQTIFKFILKNGKYLELDWHSKKLVLGDIKYTTWPRLGPYVDDIITAVQIHASVTDSYLYIFLSDNKYLKYNIDKNILEGEARDVDEGWPGLTHN